MMEVAEEHLTVDGFVTAHPHNTDATTEQEFDQQVPRYSCKNLSLYPVVVYMIGDEPIAWFDEEMGTGYIAECDM